MASLPQFQGGITNSQPFTIRLDVGTQCGVNAVIGALRYV